MPISAKNTSGTYEVAIGNRRWLEKRGITIDADIDKVMSQEEQMGHIAVLCAVDGKIQNSDQLGR